MRAYEWALNHYDYPSQKEKIWEQTQREERQCEDPGRRQLSIRHKERPGADLFYTALRSKQLCVTALRSKQPCGHLDHGLIAYITMRK